ncbi:16S rRNA (cytidine(1402)-2'-O)-methyltransferase [Legionella jordanis]|uniref:Ribosomal RNA small subunit methyltransferase I n=1 Tax=Legionella jordanis TaxID=456 RepID=A0A0W0VCR7_9GAMM|nr:16S rRNA (cytidine(1402)-2'-O)-methyltransferase [Legionella jordanis]KTD17887.1 tetrapyrrole (corrin/porphyrin) methylase [Legionella jordanis]RMX02414.1 16S rRNA (cytidine(1402)-2'-O)-methyltransferase [Legionella jordanis]VEH14022.1 tetrapyrrole (corrin/porphyrin) methylase [Legionella jordanis]HAT8713857.1 16S rRNA (cytidine(1402)-2'-O)-methyltransferase [Legionella jordanis]
MVKSSATSYGTLYIVATPIGNREDISIRALNTLSAVDSILAEDTRHSLQLLTSLGLQKPLISLHAHNEAEKSQQIIDALQNGKSFALISDAGTPLISDPGFTLVRLAREKNIEVIPIPGPCALITALSAAGVPCDSFIFSGFLPAKSKARKDKLNELRQLEHTVVLYESTHRILDCLKDIAEAFGADYCFVLAKELTKAYERFIHGNSAEIISWLDEDEAHVKGEFVLILPAKPSVNDRKHEEEILSLLLKEVPLKQAVKLTSQITKANKNEVYKLALRLEQELKFK